MKPSIEPGEFDSILPWEIQIEILSWVPVKTLMQFRCVCKSWKSLISDDKSFEKLHMHRSAKNKHVLHTLLKTGGPPCYDDNEDLCLVPCPVRRLVEDRSFMIDEDGCCNLKGKYYVLGSCNGLVCYRYTWGYHDHDFARRGRFRFWNPAMRLWSKKTPTLNMTDYMSYGFGYDDSRDTYKVVGILDYWFGGGKWATMVYCMGDRCLREISSKPSFRLWIRGKWGQFAGGCLNWLAVDELNQPNQNLPYIERQALVILSFDMRKETYRSLSLPEDTSVVNTNLSVLGNCLCLSQDSKRTHFDVWQMREYGV
ncbi:F-box/kelch-repeat protein At3g23880-like [Lotus japonicus]|uniref:F-box/kelch-repeat protein At3g23880-like n=1 Tax=Lotus japonicus TaxID=34305 RepID=UPI00258F456F|nr:F-box/kelch-repeat protein At3g23880-like [Lotus japonicus]